MANAGDILTLFDECPELLLNVNLSILRRDLKSRNNNISWLPLLTDELEKYADITSLNLFEKIRLFMEIRKYLPKILKLKDHLSYAITSTENLTLKSQLNDEEPSTIEKNVGKQNTTSIDVIQNQYYPAWIVNFVRDLDKCHVSTVRLRPDGDIECLLCHSKTFQGNVDNLERHLCSKIHLRKLSEDYLNLVKFHNFWQRQTPETWMKYLQFKYASDCLICVVCHKTVEYVDVADHLVTCSCAAVLQNSILGKIKKRKNYEAQQVVKTYNNYEDLLTTSSEDLTPKRHVNDARPTKIGKTVKERNTFSIDEIQEHYYPSSIVNFVRFLDKCDVSTVRLRPEGDIECLLCRNKTLYTNMDNIKRHLCSKRHLSNVSEGYQDLVAFHKFWRRQTVETWKKHMQFNYAFDCLRCVVCDKSVEYEDAADHLAACSEDEVLRNSALEKQKKRKISAQRIIYRDVPTITIEDHIYPTFQRLPADKGFICLVCNEHVDGLHTSDRHTTSIRHVRRQGEKTVRDSLVKYHKTWNVLPYDMQLMQTQFQRRPDMMLCKICPYKFVEYDAERVREHLKTVAHPSRSEVRYELRKASQVRLLLNPTTAARTKRDKYSAQRVVYRDVPSVKIDDDTYPTFQRLPADRYGRGFLCLVCNEQVDGLHTRDRHASSIRHVRRLGEKTVQDSLVRYHRTWSALPNDVQLMQTHFERGAYRMKCKVCPDTFVDYDAERVREHLMSVAHPSRSEIRKVPKDVWRDKFLDRTADCSRSRIKKKRPTRKYNFFLESSSDSARETPHRELTNLLPRSDSKKAEMLPQEPTNLLPRLDSNKADLWDGEDKCPQKQTNIEEETTEPTVDGDEEKTPPRYTYFDYNDVLPDFIPLTRSSAEVTSKLILNPLMVETEPSCIDNETNNTGKNSAQSVIYRDVPSIKIGDDIYPTFQRLPPGQYDKGFICLLCNEHVNELHPRERHGTSIRHVRRQGEKMVQESLLRYHWTWNALPNDMQLMQTHFERGPEKMKCRICPDAFVEYDVDCVRQHLTSVAHWSRAEIRKVLSEPWWDNILNLTEGCSTNKKKRKRHSQVSSETSSVTARETLHQDPANPLPISDNNVADLNEGEDKRPQKRTKIEEVIADPTDNPDEGKTPQGYIFIDYNEPDFIPLTRNYPKVTSELVLNPMMVKIKPCSGDNDTSVVDEFYQQSTSSSDHAHLEG